MDDQEQGIRWWNGLQEWERRAWMREAGSARPVDAWEEFKRWERTNQQRGVK